MSQEQQERQQEVQQSERPLSVSEVSAVSNVLANEQIPDEDSVEDVSARTGKKGKGKKRAMRRTPTQAELEAVMPRPSYWPIALAFSVVVFLFGVIGNVLLFMIPGALFIVVCAVGWGLERR